MKNTRIAISALALSAFCSVAFAGPVSHYGKIKVVGNKIMDAAGTNEVQLKGPSLFWSTASADKYYSNETVDWFVDNMKISVIRAAMAIQYYKRENGTNSQPITEAPGDFGYLSTSAEPNSKTLMTERIERVVQAAITNDIYVIIDWHSHTAISEQTEAVAFFRTMATKYKDVPNVLYEVFNEPVEQSWSSINSYSSAVIGAIRAAGSTQLVIVGSPQWSSQPNTAAGSSLHSGGANVAYSLHFYAGTHGASYRSNADQARNANAAVFATEWGTVNADGGGSPNASSTNEWTTWMDQKKISNCNWSVYSAFQGTTGLVGAQGSNMFTDLTGTDLAINRLSASGNLFYNYVKNGIAVPSGYPVAKSLSISMAEGQSHTFTASELGLTNGNITAVTSIPASSGTVAFTGNTITYQSPAVGSPASVRFNYTVTSGSRTSKERITVKIDRQIVFRDTTIAVSYTKTTTATPGTLGASDPTALPLTFTSCTGGTGNRVMAGDRKSFVYTPPANSLATATFRDDPFTCTVSNGTKSSTKAITFRVTNLAPTVYATRTFSTANTAPLLLTLPLVKAADKDGDSLTFSTVQVTPGYPGVINLAADKKAFAYVPPAGQYGTVTVSYTVTDGAGISNVGVSTITVTGTGTPIVQSVPLLHSERHLLPKGVALQGNWLSFDIQEPGRYRVEMVNMVSGRVELLHQGPMAFGSNQVRWNAAGHGAGVHWLRVRNVESGIASTYRLMVD